jgi:flagellar L-ring protein precursor FlgH
MIRAPVLILAAAAVLAAGAARAGEGDLYRGDPWASLAADRAPRHVGDALMVLVYENAQASSVARFDSRKSNRLGARAGSETTGDRLEAEAASAFDGEGRSTRSGKLLAQISVTVDAVLPNGDLRVSGVQVLTVDGERTTLRLSGRARPADIYQNAVVSSRLADVTIDYDGKGVVTRSGRPGLLARIINSLGVL